MLYQSETAQALAVLQQCDSHGRMLKHAHGLDKHLFLSVAVLVAEDIVDGNIQWVVCERVYRRLFCLFEPVCLDLDLLLEVLQL